MKKESFFRSLKPADRYMIGNLFFGMVKKLSEFRISSHVGYDLQNAVYYRIFHLPESFCDSFFIPLPIPDVQVFLKAIVDGAPNAGHIWDNSFLRQQVDTKI